MFIQLQLEMLDVRQLANGRWGLGWCVSSGPLGGSEQGGGLALPPREWVSPLLSASSQAQADPWMAHACVL